MACLAVIDVETTGLNPYRHDRIIEVSVLIATWDGSVVQEFTSIVNPCRDVGRTDIHGLTAADVALAPRFTEIATELLNVLAHASVIVGHNVRFDVSFLRTEYRRIGVELPHCHVIDTMHVSGGGTLADCCARMGVTMEGDAHESANDTLATARLFFALLEESPSLAIGCESLPALEWPEISLPAQPPVVRATVRARQTHSPDYIGALARELPPSPPEAPRLESLSAYAALLSESLEDRHIDAEEGQYLVDLATASGLTFDQIAEVHGDYLRRLVKAACRDGTVTTEEQQEIMLVARLLGFEEMTQPALEDLIHAVAAVNDNPADQAATQVDLSGKRVCFTGDSQCRVRGRLVTRDMAKEMAQSRGLIVVDTVTKKLDMLVVADPHSQSGKAKKARQYDLRIVHEPEFWRLLGIGVE